MGFAFILDSVGGTEWFVLLGVILIVVGPKNLPSAARKLGQVMSNLRRAADEFKRQLMTMDQEVRNTVNDALSVDSTTSSSSSDSSSSSESSSEETPEEGEDLYSEDNPYPGHDGYYDENYGGDYGDGSDEDGTSDGDTASGDEGESSEPSAPAQPPPPSDEELRRVKITVSTAPRKGK